MADEQQDVAQPVVPQVPDIKPGVKTSEFSTMVVTMMTILTTAIMGFLPPEKAVTLMAMVGSIYTIARAGIKIAHDLGYAKSIPDLPMLNLAQMAPGGIPLQQGDGGGNPDGPNYNRRA